MSFPGPQPTDAHVQQAGPSLQCDLTPPGAPSNIHPLQNIESIAAASTPEMPAPMSTYSLQQAGAQTHTSQMHNFKMSSTPVNSEMPCYEPHFLSPELKDMAALGEYINLEDFLPLEYSHTKFALNPTPIIDSFEMWLKAWNNYERILMIRNCGCSLYHSLVSYRDLIQVCKEDYPWPAVYTYDRSFRAELSKTHSFDFGTVNQTMYIGIFHNPSAQGAS